MLEKPKFVALEVDGGGRNGSPQTTAAQFGAHFFLLPRLSNRAVVRLLAFLLVVLVLAYASHRVGPYTYRHIFYMSPQTANVKGACLGYDDLMLRLLGEMARFLDQHNLAWFVRYVYGGGLSWGARDAASGE